MQERYLTACHEYGHGVASLARGGTFRVVSIEPERGLTQVVHPKRYRDFVTFAGPWAEARAEWAGLPPNGLNSDGKTFDNILTEMLEASPVDLGTYAPGEDLLLKLFAARQWGEPRPEIPLARSPSWYRELERYWPTIESAARMHLNGNAVPAWIVRRMLLREYRRATGDPRESPVGQRISYLRGVGGNPVCWPALPYC